MKPTNIKKRKVGKTGIDAAIIHLGIHFPATPVSPKMKQLH
jgi:hypothetical protein